MKDRVIPPALAPAYQQCREVHREHSRTSYLATSLLPRERRPHVWAVYAFARTSRDLVDRPRSDPREALPAWRHAVLSALASDTPPGPVAPPAPGAPPGPTAPPVLAGPPVLAALWHTQRVVGLPGDLFEDYLGSLVMDLTVTRYATWEDLRGYMSGSAAALGEMMAPLFGATDPAVRPRARALGEAFHFTTVVRDIAEDLARGRVYLPEEDLAAHGVTADDLARSVASRRPDDAVRSLVTAEVERGLALYEEAMPGLALVDARSRAGLQTAFSLYREVLVEVGRQDGNVFDGRVRASRAARAATVARVLRRRGR